MTNEDAVMYFRTSRGSPNYRLIGIDLKNMGEEAWTTLIPEHPKDVLDWVSCVNL